MEIKAKQGRLEQLNRQIVRQQLTIIGLTGSIILLALFALFREQIVILKTPGYPGDEIFSRTSIDRSTQSATLLAVTSALASINPSNKQHVLLLLQAYLAADVYTKTSMQIEALVKRKVEQKELGSGYFVFRDHSYDPETNRHFVRGDVHTVNAASDTAKPYVFEYEVAYENYRVVVKSITVYEGDTLHNAQWNKQQAEKK